MRNRAANPDLVGAPSADVVAWRGRRLRRAGFDAELADALGADVRIDLHAVLVLVERGCPPALAARIMAPLDAPERSTR